MSRQVDATDTTPPVFHTTNTHFVVLDSDHGGTPDTTVVVVRAQRIWTGPGGRMDVQAPAATMWELTPVFWSNEQKQEWEIHTSATQGHVLVKGEDQARDAANELAGVVHQMNVEHATVLVKHAKVANDLVQGR